MRVRIEFDSQRGKFAFRAGVALAAVLAVGFPIWLSASQVGTLISFHPGDLISASTVNANFDALAVAIDDTDNKVGLLSNLTTTTKTNVVAAIDEVNAKVGGGVTTDSTITGNGTSATPLSVSFAQGNATYDARYLQLAGGTLTGLLQGTNVILAPATGPYALQTTGAPGSPGLPGQPALECTGGLAGADLGSGVGGRSGGLGAGIRGGNGSPGTSFTGGDGGVGLSVGGGTGGAGTGFNGGNGTDGIQTAGGVGGAGVLGGFGGAGILAIGGTGGAGTTAAGSTGPAGVFNGTVSKTAGTFKIDHPLDPDNKFLYHSFVESPDMMNIYNGIVVLNDKGEATVELPSYFEALNMDPRYQLTCVGGFAPVYVSEEIHGNRFAIAGGKPGLKVSWQVTGIRQDAYAKAHRIVPEVAKSPTEKGKLLHPVEQGRPESDGIYWPLICRARGIDPKKAAAEERAKSRLEVATSGGLVR
jgi:hypothetical protein